jgi:tetratricopeptide (TPR) repeat protein
MKRAALALALLASFFGGAARADTPPTAWDCARDPEARSRWALHVRVQQMLVPPPASEDLPQLELRRGYELQLEHARAVLESADAEHSPDVRLRFDLGAIYVELGERLHKDDLFRRAIAVLAPAVDADPEHPAATKALERLADAYAHLDRAPEELTAWRRHLARVSDDRIRVGEMMNMGEAEMRLGLIDDALATFREVLRLCGELPNTGGATYVLTLWDLAVALDRSGDPRGALDTAAKASATEAIASNGMRMRGSSLIAPHAQGGDDAVFFVPEWQREWYLALASAAAAREAHDARDEATLWADAEAHWSRYVTGASSGRSSDPWLAVARVRLSQTHAQRLAAEKRAAKLPRRPAMGGPWIDD